MTSKAKFKSDAFEAIHSAALGLHRAGTVDKATMRGIDELGLTALPVIAPLQIHLGPVHQAVDQRDHAGCIGEAW